MSKKFFAVAILAVSALILSVSIWHLRQIRNQDDAQRRLHDVIESHNESILASRPDRGEKTHKHADFKVFIDGVAIDFSQAKYQSSKNNPLDPDAHLHDGNGSVVHFHRERITLREFFQSLGMDLISYPMFCFVTDDKRQHCGGSFGVYVNDRLLNDDEKDPLSFPDYIPRDLDRILITVGGMITQQELEQQFSSLTSDACIYSEKCPERGLPPKEECVGSVETGCE